MISINTTRKKEIKKQEDFLSNKKPLPEDPILIDYSKEFLQIYKRQDINVHILDEAISYTYTAYKTNLTMVEKGSINKFRVKKLKTNRRKRILCFQPS